MDDNGTEAEDPSSVQDVVGAITALLDRTQTELDYPYDPSGSAASKPSTTLDYRLNAEIEVELATEWPLFAGLTLTNISLQTQIAKAKGIPGQLFVSLTATATVGDISVTVSGSIPNLSSGTPIDLLLSIEAAGTLASIQPANMVSSLTNNSYDFVNVSQHLDDSVRQQVEGGDDGISFVTGAYVVVTRNTDGIFWLRNLGFSLYGDIDWPMVDSGLTLSDVSLDVELSRESAGASWDASLDLGGTVIVNGASLSVVGSVDLGAIPAIDLVIKASALGRFGPDDVVEGAIGPTSGSKYEAALKQLALPIEFPSDDMNSFEARLSLAKDPASKDVGSAGAGLDDPRKWYVGAADITLNWDGMSWYPLPGVPIVLRALYFKCSMSRAALPIVAKPSDAQLVYKAVFGGALKLADVPVAVLVSYESVTESITLTCAIDDAANVSLQDIATDPLFNPPDRTKVLDLAADASSTPVPDGVPVDLSWCTARSWRTNIVAVMTFDQTTLTRLFLKADFNINWQITSTLTLTDMGLMFDISNPMTTNNGPPMVVKGYAYGQMMIGNNLKVFAFVAGVKDSTRSLFTVGFSVTLDPLASLGQRPQDLIEDPQFLGHALDTTGWNLPDSLPATASVLNALTSTEASLLLQIQQLPKQDGSGAYNTSVSSLQAMLNVTGEWTIIDQITLEAVSVKVLLPLGDSSKQIADKDSAQQYYFCIAGSLSADMTSVEGVDTVKVVLMATLQKTIAQPATFHVDIVASTSGVINDDESEDTVSLSQLLKMKFTGLDAVDVAKDPTAQTVPSELAASPSSLLSGPATKCSLTVQKVSDKWQWQSLFASMTQKDTWVIVPGKLEVSNSSIRLLVTNPRGVDSLPQRKIQFSAATKVKVGNVLDIDASITVSVADGKENTLVAVLSASTYPDILNALIGAAIELPTGTPDLQKCNATLTVVCNKTSSSWQIQSVAVEATASVGWELGPFKLDWLAVTATFTKSDTTMVPSVVFKSAGLVSKVPINLEFAYQSKPQETISITVTSEIQPTQVVGAFVTGGLDSGSSLQPPSLPAGTGLSSYATTPAAQVIVVFTKTGSWSPQFLKLELTSGAKEWVLVDDDILVASHLTLSLTLQLSSGSKKHDDLELTLGLWFEFQKRAQPAGEKGALKCSATATTDQLVITIDTSDCSMAQFLYTVTGGSWDPADDLDLPSINSQDLLEALILTLNWDKGVASFTALLKDWHLSDRFPRLLGISRPRFEATITRSSQGYSAVGQLAGSAIAFGVEVPMSYVLPDGPFLVCGVDVKKTYEMVKKLYDAIKKVKDIVEVAEEVAAAIAELAEFAGVAEIASDVASAFTALGVVKDTIDKLLDKWFSHDSSASSGSNNDDPSSNHADNSKGTPSLVLGGTALSPGPMTQSVDLQVYPKDRFGHVLLPFDSSKLSLEFTPGGADTALVVDSTWSSIPAGCQTTMFRMESNGTMKVTYSGQPVIETNFENTVQFEPSIFSFTNSILEFPSAIDCLSRGVVIVRPRDQYNQARYGPTAAPALVVQSFIQAGGSALPTYDSAKGFVRRNDSMLLQFSLPTAGRYTLTIADPTDPTSTRSATITGINAIDPQHCIASGDGLGSGKGGQNVSFSVALRDQDGNSYVPADTEPLSIHISLSTQLAELPWARTADVINCTYNRPVDGQYSVQIWINNGMVRGGSIDLEATAGDIDVSVSVAKSQCSIMNTTIAAGDLIEGRLILYDTVGSRWSKPGSATTFALSTSVGLGAPTIVDCGDGTFKFHCLTTSRVGPAWISVSAVADSMQHAQGSPMSFDVVAARQLANVTAYGPGMVQAKNEETNIITISGRDQYGDSCAVRLEANCHLIAACDGQEIVSIANQSGSSNFAYRLLPSNSSEVLVLLRPLGDAIFSERVYVVPRTNQGSTSPTTSFVTWTNVDTSGNTPSHAIIHARSSTLFPCQQGGDLVEVGAAPGAPFVLIDPIQDFQDGTYGVSFTMPSIVPPGQKVQLRVGINNEEISWSPFVLPRPIEQIVSATVSGLSQEPLSLGEEHSFSVSCLDARGQLSLSPSLGYSQLDVTVVQVNARAPRFVRGSPGAFDKGIIPVKFTIPETMGTGDYHCHVIFNGAPIVGSPFSIVVTAVPKPVSIDDIEEACQITQHTLATPLSRWKTSSLIGWMVANDLSSGSPVALVTNSIPRSSDDEQPSAFSLNLPLTDEWFRNGILFCFDLAVEVASSFILTPVGQPGDNRRISMTWTASNPKAQNPVGRCAWRKSDEAGPITIPQADRVTTNWPSASTIGFFYLLSPQDKMTLIVFQAGQFIAQYVWLHTGTLPQLGFSVQRRSDDRGVMHISNIMTIPSYFRNLPRPLTATASSFQSGCEPSRAIDGDRSTFWHTESFPTLMQPPHTFTIDLGAVYSISSLSYLPRQDGSSNGNIGEHDVHVSVNGIDWIPMWDGNTLSTWPDNQNGDITYFGPLIGRYVRLTVISAVGNQGPGACAAELTVGYTSSSLESPSEIDFAAPWAAKYVDYGNSSGTLSNRGFVINGKAHPTLVNGAYIKQLPVPLYGHSVSVYSLDIPVSYNFSGRQWRTPSVMFPNVMFAGIYYNTNTGSWESWKFYNRVVRAGPDAGLCVSRTADGGSLNAGLGYTTNTVYCITGQNCVTIIANGRFVLTATEDLSADPGDVQVRMVPITSVEPPRLWSWWTDVVWHRLRVWPPLTPPPQ